MYAYTCCHLVSVIVELIHPSPFHREAVTELLQLGQRRLLLDFVPDLLFHCGAKLLNCGLFIC